MAPANGANDADIDEWAEEEGHEDIQGHQWDPEATVGYGQPPN